MKKIKLFFMLIFFIFIGFLSIFLYLKRGIKIIAYKGGSSHFPEETFQAQAYSAGLGVNYIEIDVNVTKDKKVIVNHDFFIDHTYTDVIEKYPSLIKRDGRFYTMDLTLKEINDLKIDTSKTDRYISYNQELQINTLKEELKFFRALLKKNYLNIKLLIEIKNPNEYKHYGIDISSMVINVLKDLNWDGEYSKYIALQTFDLDELKRIKIDLYPKYEVNYELFAVLGSNYFKETKVFYKDGTYSYFDYDSVFNRNSIIDLAEYCDGFTVWAPMVLPAFIVKNFKEDFNKMSKKYQALNILNSIENGFSLIALAKKKQKKIFIYNFKQANKIALLNFKQQIFIFSLLGIDGIITEEPKEIIKILRHDII